MWSMEADKFQKELINMNWNKGQGLRLGYCNYPYGDTGELQITGTGGLRILKPQ